MIWRFCSTSTCSAALLGGEKWDWACTCILFYMSLSPMLIGRKHDSKTQQERYWTSGWFSEVVVESRWRWKWSKAVITCGMWPRQRKHGAFICPSDSIREGLPSLDEGIGSIVWWACMFAVFFTLKEVGSTRMKCPHLRCEVYSHNKNMMGGCYQLFDHCTDGGPNVESRRLILIWRRVAKWSSSPTQYHPGGKSSNCIRVSITSVTLV